MFAAYWGCTSRSLLNTEATVIHGLPSWSPKLIFFIVFTYRYVGFFHVFHISISDPLILGCNGSETFISLVSLKIWNRRNYRYSQACFNKEKLLNNPQLRLLILLVHNSLNHAPFQLHWTNFTGILMKCRIRDNYLLSNHCFRMFM